ncbi:MAG: pseudaminic acid cytidylyltransferase [Alkalimonas sp.]|nr:pseudaminic acid cytidylyltransferase [Alkalimonas sp.]
MNIAIIPARGGSKRIPRKNIKDFCGQPMISYPIKTALQSDGIDRVIVSTEDEEIAEIARGYGAETPFLRPKELADDYTGTSAIIRHALHWLAEQQQAVEFACCLYATTPLLQPDDLQAGLAMLKANSELDFVFSAARFSFPIQRALLQDKHGGVLPFDADSIKKRSQDLPPAFHDAGQFYWGKASSWLRPGAAVFSPSSRMLVLPDHRVQDIDTPDDWRRAEVLYQLLQQEQHHEGIISGR